MEYGILESLTKSYILSQITQEQIFEYYLGIKVEVEVLLTTPSVIRPRDSNPTFSFKYSDNGKLRARDWAGYFWGDCFDVVAYVLRVNANDKKSFMVILDQIARDFRLHKYADKITLTGNTFDPREATKIPRGKVLIQFQPRGWDKNIDGKFWLSGNINSKLLEIGRVFPCQYIWLNNNLNYNFNPKDRAYAYYFTPNDIKIYFPDRTKYRFLSNTSYLQGIDLLEPDEFGIITKSYKDVLSLKSFGIQAVAPPSETVPISLADWHILRRTCNHWFTLMDFDRTGILMTRKLRDLYGTRPLFFSNYKTLQKLIDKNGEFKGNKLASNYPSYAGVKDFYDKIKLFGVDSTRLLIDNTRKLYEEEFNNFNKNMYEDLSWIKNNYYRQQNTQPYVIQSTTTKS